MISSRNVIASARSIFATSSAWLKTRYHNDPARLQSAWRSSRAKTAQAASDLPGRMVASNNSSCYSRLFTPSGRAPLAGAFAEAWRYFRTAAERSAPKYTSCETAESPATPQMVSGHELRRDRHWGQCLGGSDTSSRLRMREVC